MTWPTQTTTLNDALASVDRAAANLKQRCSAFRVKSGATSVAADEITEDLLRYLMNAKAVFARAAGLSGIADYVAGQRGTTSEQVVAAFTAMSDAVTSAIAWIAANLPKDGNGYLLVRTIAADGTMAYRTFAPAVLANLRTILQSVEDTVA